MDESRVKHGDWAVLASSDGRQVLGHVVPGSTVRVGRLKRDLYDVHDGDWGTLYAPQQEELVPCAEVPDDDAAVDDDVGEADNRTLQDNNDNQLLTQRDITRMRRDGRKSGAAVVNAVVSNSATFRSKTKFSQEKYVRRKRNKFDVRVRVIKPTAFSLCQTYFRKAPEKIMNIRTDTLALLIGSAGIAPGRHVLVVDECTGLVTGAVAERLRGFGRILNMFNGCTPPGNEILRMLNLPKEINDAIVAVPFDVVPGGEGNSNGNRNTQSATRCDDDDEPIRYTARDDEEDLKYPTSEKRAQSIAKRPKLGLVKQWMKDGFDCLVIAARNDVIETFDLLFQLLAPSGTFAAYCPHIQDAAELQFALQMSKLAIRVELTESLLTQHQILPGRSHPEMSGSATGGYIVSGIRVELPQSAP